jgi:hypothetical protein
MKPSVILVFFIQSVSSLIEIERCIGLAEQKNFWKRISDGYDKQQPPPAEVITVFLRVNINVVENIDVNSGSAKVQFTTW